MARKLSISTAWDQTREVLRRDGRLIATVALALLVLPSTVQALVSPEAPAGKLPEPGAWMVVALIAVLVGLVGQLAVIRLAIGSQTSVGEAISHGARRMPALVGSMLLWLVPMVGMVFALADAMRQPDPSPAIALGLLGLLVLLVYLGVRLISASAVAGAENAGPIGILKRSWTLSRGRWWRLFGFLVLFVIAAVTVMFAAEALVGLLVRILFGTPEPMSIGALILALVRQLALSAVTVVFLVMLARIYVQLSAPEPVEASVPSSGT
jgi:hypothetical protein